MGFGGRFRCLERCCGIFAISASQQRTDEEEMRGREKVVMNAFDERQCELTQAQ